VSRRLALAIIVWLGVGAVVGHGFFDVLVTRGEKHYLLSQARAELGLAEPVTLDGVMRRTIRDALKVAVIWGGLVAGAGIVSALVLERSGRQPRLRG